MLLGWMFVSQNIVRVVSCRRFSTWARELIKIQVWDWNGMGYLVFTLYSTKDHGNEGGSEQDGLYTRRTRIYQHHTYTLSASAFTPGFGDSGLHLREHYGIRKFGVGWDGMDLGD